MSSRLFLASLGLFLGCSSSDFSTAPQALDSAVADSVVDSTKADAEPVDSTTSDVALDTNTSDTATADAPKTDSALADTSPPLDAGPRCEGLMPGFCPAGSSCVSCPAGGPSNKFLCSTNCKSNAQCTDPTLPKCNQPGTGLEGICTSNDFTCAWGAVSTRKAKDDIVYVTDAEQLALAKQALALKLATYHYKRDPTQTKKLGYILEDSPGAASSDLAREEVDLYAYASMVLAATKVQEKRLDALEKEMASLRAKCGK